MRDGPMACTRIRRRMVEGRPVQAHVSTSRVECMNVSVRMQNRRVMQLMSAF